MIVLVKTISVLACMFFTFCATVIWVARGSRGIRKEDWQYILTYSAAAVAFAVLAVV